MRTDPAGSRLRTGLRRGVTGLAAAALAATGLAIVPGTASANGNCVAYWAAGTGSWSGAPAAGGTGTAADPYKVGNTLDLNEVRFCGDKHFVQINDVPISDDFNPWDPIAELSGSYDGGGHSLTGLKHSDGAADNVGLFALITGTGRVTDLSLDAVEITGQDYVGALAGRVFQTTEISKVTVGGTVTGRQFVGGLVGHATSLGAGAAEATPQATGPVVREVASSTTVSGTDYVGGLVGYAEDTTVTESAVSVTITGANDVGGVLGYAQGSTLSKLASSAIVTASDFRAGGILGTAVSTSLTESAAYGTTNSQLAAGGAVGQIREEVTLSELAADVTTSGSQWVGGLVGDAQGYPAATITKSVAAGAVTGDASVGGLVGRVSYASAAITDSSASGTVSGRMWVGGLVGMMTGDLARSSASGNVTASAEAAGGLVGLLMPSGGVCSNAEAAICAAVPAPETPTKVRESFATGKVQAASYAGGLVGQMPNTGFCTGSADVQACAAVTAESTSEVSNSYATGAASADSQAGGLIGSAADVIPVGDDVTAAADATSVVNSYASGVVTGADRGGLVGGNGGSLAVTESFWDSTANPAISGGKGTAKTQSQLRDITTFSTASWKIQNGAPASGDNVWGICVPPDSAVHNGYPFLLWQHTQINPCHPVPVAPVLKSLTPGNKLLQVVATLGADGGNPVTNVQYRLDGGEWIDSGGATGSFTISGLVNGRTYKVQVRAINAIGASPASNELSGTPGNPTTVLKVKGLPGGKKLKVGKRNVLVTSVRTNGTLTVARVFCTLKGNRLPPRLRDRLCAPTINRATATSGDVTATAKTRKKKLRITATPDCSTGLRVNIKVAAKAKGAKRKVVTRSYRVANKPAVKCRIKGTG